MTTHLPVLASQVVDLLQVEPGMTVVDATLGGGGHTALLADRVAPSGTVIALDRDPNAVETARGRFAGQSVMLFAANYVQLPAILRSISIDAVDAILLDLGVSSDQIADRSRGFSFQGTGELDMRFDPRTGEAAWQLLQRWNEQEIADVIYRFGEERYSRRIARRIVAQRSTQPVRTADQLAALVRQCVPRTGRHSIDPATRTFQALRIAVNDELVCLQSAVSEFPDLLRPHGRLAVIAFHSLEDRIVKHAFRDDPRLEVISKRPVRADAQEIDLNPRSRSARLRVARRRAPDE